MRFSLIEWTKGYIIKYSWAEKLIAGMLETDAYLST